MTSAIDWSSLTHAYGPASDIPELLDEARHAPAGGDYRDEPWYSLWSALCHQGDVYTASLAALPQLVAIAKARLHEHDVARECRLLAGAIELERTLPEGNSSPPPIPLALAKDYHSALAEGSQLVEVLHVKSKIQSTYEVWP